MTHVATNALDRTLIVRYDPAVTSQAAVVAGINQVVSDIGR